MLYNIISLAVGALIVYVIMKVRDERRIIYDYIDDQFVTLLRNRQDDLHDRDEIVKRLEQNMMNDRNYLQSEIDRLRDMVNFPSHIGE